MGKKKEKGKQELTQLARYYIINHPKVIPLLKSKYVTDDMLMICMEESPSIFADIPNPTKRVILRALELDGGNLKYIPKKLRSQLPMDFFLIAIESNPSGALPYIPKQYLSEDGKGESLDKEFLRKRIEECPSDIKYLSDPSNELKCIALRQDPNVALYFEDLTPEMMDIIDELYPSLKDSLPNYRR